MPNAERWLGCDPLKEGNEMPAAVRRAGLEKRPGSLQAFCFTSCSSER